MKTVMSLSAVWSCVLYIDDISLQDIHPYALTLLRGSCNYCRPTMMTVFICTTSGGGGRARMSDLICRKCFGSARLADNIRSALTKLTNCYFCHVSTNIIL